MQRRRRRPDLRALAALAVAPLVALAACAPAPPVAPTVSETTTTVAPTTTVPWTTVRAGTGPGYGITIRFQATLAPELVGPAVDAFNAAAARWEQVITADVADVTAPGFNGCGNAGPVGTIDDLVIDVTIAPMDGVGGVLGSAGFCARNGTIATAGVMTFDSADVGPWLTAGRFDRVVLHEMGHVLGIGTMWGYAGYVTGSVDGSRPCGESDPRFTGPAAVAEWRALDAANSTDTGVPIEACGGAGTALAHWRETTFRSELMTGWISLTSSPLSRLSVASLGDLGFQVDLGAADPYILGSSVLDALVPGADAHEDPDGADDPHVHEHDHEHDHEHGFILLTPDGPIGTD